MSNLNSIKGDKKENEDNKRIKKLLKKKNLNLKNSKDLKYLLSLTLQPTKKKYNFNYLLSFLVKYLNSTNESIFYEYLFQSCELGKLNYVKILLEKGLSVNYQNELGETPLHIAISKNDIGLIELLIKYEPNTNLKTKNDGFTVMNYAEMQNNKKVIKIIEDLIKKKLIKYEIINYINKDMNNIKTIEPDDISLFLDIDNNLEEIQNYNGEIISIIDEEENISKNNINKKFMNTQQILNESDLNEEISPKNIIKVDNYTNNINNINNRNKNGIFNDKNHQRYPTEDCFCNNKKLKRFPASLKYRAFTLYTKEESLNYCHNNSIIPSFVQSLTTANTLNREKYDSPLIINKTSKLFNKKAELSKFILDINLSKKYLNNLIDNGFDDLEVLIIQSKNGIALTDQNLKDIGINLNGDRAKILIHLEELAGNFPFLLEKNIIYSNKIEKNKNNSLYTFLASIHLEEYINRFYEKGYYNAELLYTQMVSKFPLTEDVLKTDFGINKIGHIKRIMLNLVSCSENYIQRLKYKNIENKYYKPIITFDSNPYLKACEECLIF